MGNIYQFVPNAQRTPQTLSRLTPTPTPHDVKPPPKSGTLYPNLVAEYQEGRMPFENIAEAAKVTVRLMTAVFTAQERLSDEEFRGILRLLSGFYGEVARFYSVSYLKAPKLSTLSIKKPGDRILFEQLSAELRKVKLRIKAPSDPMDPILKLALDHIDIDFIYAENIASQFHRGQAITQAQFNRAYWDVIYAKHLTIPPSSTVRDL